MTVEEKSPLSLHADTGILPILCFLLYRLGETELS